MAELKPCPFCGGRPIVGTTTRGSSILCSRCGVRMEYLRMDGQYSSIATAKRWTYPTVEMKWNRRAGDGNDS